MADLDRTTPASPEGAFADLLAYSELVTTPRLAEMYSFVLREGPVTVATIKDELEMPHSTAYKYVQQLESWGVLERTDETPATVAVEPVVLELDTDAGTVVAGPVLVEAIARQTDDEEIELFVDRHGVPKLAAALAYTERIVEGDLTQGRAADELGVHRVEGSTVFAALNDVIQESPRARSS